MSFDFLYMVFTRDDCFDDVFFSLILHHFGVLVVVNPVQFMQLISFSMKSLSQHQRAETESKRQLKANVEVI